MNNYLKKILSKLRTIYCSGTTSSYIAIVVTSVVTLATISIAAIILISNATKADSVNANVTESSASEYSLTETTTEYTSIDVTTDSATSSEFTTVEESTTEEETTTPPETIPIEDLNIGNPEDDNEKYIDRSEIVDNFQEEDLEPETPASTNTAPPSTTKPPQTPTTTKPTEPPTEPPVSEYACVVKGIDISKWNSLDKKAIDWDKVKRSGVEFVIIRAGYRSQSTTAMYEDPYFKQHIEGALSAGLQVGVYFYSQAITEKEALEEASYLLSIIKGYKLTYPVCFDWEPVSGSRAAKANLSKSQATAIAKKFLSTMEGYGYEAMLYSYHSAIKNYFDTSKLSEYKTWMAYYFKKYNNTGVQYAIGDPLPVTSYPYQMWQYSSTGVVPGIQGVVDLNVSFFSYTGSGVPTSAIVLNLPKTSYITNKGISVDYTTGLKAFNTAGLDVSSQVTTAIKDKNGKIVSKDLAFKTPGIYTITYTIKDFTGVSKSANATLTVRNTPAFTFNSDTLTFVREEHSYDSIIEIIRNNLICVKDHEGTAMDLSKVNISGIDAFYHVTETSPTEDETTSDGHEEDTTTSFNEEATTENASDAPVSSESLDTDATSSTEEVTSYVNDLILGKYTITYSATDSKGSTGEGKITVIITDEKNTAENTSEFISDSESSSENDTTIIN